MSIFPGPAGLLIVLLAAAAPTGPREPDRVRLAAGERAYQKCYSCHAIEPGRNDLTGPTLHRVVGRKIAAEPGFRYSAALRKFADRHHAWSEPLLDKFVADPEALVPGTDMTFHGISDPAERRALIVWLSADPTRTEE